MSDQKFYFDSVQDAESIAAFLQALVEGFSKGEISLSANGERIMLCPHGLLNFTVKAKYKRGESKVSLRISWKERGVKDDSRPESTLRIG